MQEHHVFVVPSAFDSNLADEYCFSIPTKLPELLASGRPTIVYGPDVMEAHRFCNDNRCHGYLIDEKIGRQTQGFSRRNYGILPRTAFCIN